MKDCCKTYLDEQFGGDAGIVNEIYAEYVASIGEKRMEAKAALSAGDWAALDRVAHAVKGNALAAGDAEMAEAAIALRNAAKLQDGGEAGARLARMEDLAAGL